MAGELGVLFISIYAPSIASGISGESEKTLRDTFNEAKRVASCLLFIDEIDAITPKREVLKGRWRDAALRRAGRFDHEISMGVPDDEGRAKILKVLCAKLRLEGDFNFNALAKATLGYVGADHGALAGAAGIFDVKRIFKQISDGTLTLPDPEPQVVEARYFDGN